MKPADLAPLLAIAETVDAAAQARLGAALAAERAVRARLDALDAQAEVPDGPVPPAELAARTLHARWTARQRQALLQEQARQRAAVEVARMEASRALGRREAISALIEEAEAEVRRRRIARAGFSATPSRAPPG